MLYLKDIKDWRDCIGQVVCCDCLDLMKIIPDKVVNLVLTDMPYGVGLKYDIYQDTDENWIKMFCALIPQIKRISTMAIMPCCQIKKLPFIYQKYPPEWLICWYKGSPGHRAFVGFNDWEPLLVYGKNKDVQMHDYFFCQPEFRVDGHPCPKSIRWAAWLIKHTTQESDLIFDPFAGSFTTALAAEQLGRRWIACDISEKYCEIGEKRLTKERSQLKLNFKCAEDRKGIVKWRKKQTI